MSPRLLIADADPIQRRHLESLVNRLGYAAETVQAGSSVQERLLGSTTVRSPAIDLLLLDLDTPGLDARALLSTLEQTGRKIPTIVQVSSSAIESALSMIRSGASDFVVKPVGPERLRISIEAALHVAMLEAEVIRLGRQAARCTSFAEIACKSEAMDRIARLGEKAARTSMPVLLEGEPGSGKETVARAIHGASDRRGRAFIGVNCRSLPTASAWSALFGHEKGAFGGAEEKQAGKLLEAQGGTLLLDEVGALPIEVQAGLLRALQAGEIEPAGAKRPVKIDIRFVFATTQNLIELVSRGLFREDLYYRLNMVPIAIPPLRARREDIGDLARRFCARFAAEQGKPVRAICAEALDLLERYDWPGNIRQLENVIYRAVALAEGSSVTVADLPQVAARVEGFGVRIPPAPTAEPERRTEFVPVEVRDPNVLALLDATGRMRKLDGLEADAIRFALAFYHGQISATARGLGIGRSTLYRKMRDYGLFETCPAPGFEVGEGGVGGAAA